MNKITHGPFTWHKRPSLARPQEEVWELERPIIVKMTSFVLKNYGGHPDPTNRNAFSGWRLVSGGPFTEVGGWNSFEEALPAVTSWLIRYYTEEAQVQLENAIEVIRHVSNFQAVLSAGDQSR